MRKVKLVAHRGESAVAPENTVESYVLAWRNGVSWGVETDVYLTRDNVLVCMHDASAQRTANVAWLLRDHTLAELKQLDVGVWKGAQWLNCRIPTLREVLLTLPREGHIFVEIKSAGGGFAKAFEEARLGAGVSPEQVSFISFSGEELQLAGRELPEYRRYLLCWMGKEPDGGPSLSADALIAELKKWGVDGVDIGPNHCYDAEYVEKVHRAGFAFNVWTVDDLETAKRLESYGVDSITTNCPAKLAAMWP
ncbi:MAG: glycerophosphodiester phosphodiesterase family protein [Victivallaceae bacterium]|nr:glycerophosphodiester phosphodiesterase family protein [Victivallaceae bacterium]